MRDQESSKPSEEPNKLKYLNQLFGVEDHLLREVREHARSENREGMQLSPYEGQMLKCVTKWCQALNVLELGTLFGYSTLWLAQGLGGSGRITTVEKDPNRQAKASEFFKRSKHASKINSICADAAEVRAELEKLAPFDLIFIDANKSAYLDTLIWSETVLKKDGFLVGDNTFFFGAVYGEQVSARWGEKAIKNMQEFNKRLADPSQYLSTLIPTSEGLTIAQKLFK